jgi:GNAT superfamily N-acetyltransferase
MNSTIDIRKTTSKNPDFIALITKFDAYLWSKYSELQSNYWGNNVIEINNNVLLIYFDGKAVASGCFKEYDKNTVEIKRMFVLPEARGMGFAKRILEELEILASQKEYSYSILETLNKQEEAIALYQKVGYVIIDNYEPYIGLERSVCLKKQIK